MPAFLPVCLPACPTYLAGIQVFAVLCYLRLECCCTWLFQAEVQQKADFPIEAGSSAALCID